MGSDPLVWHRHGNPMGAHCTPVRFVTLNDRIWGESNWVSCPICPHDDNDRHIYHHKNAHS